ncbi:MAG: DNA-directed RNA polymerase subunit A'' [Candidatus Ranarchaeia archaeon]|jgi:DNA-directed RNA polymerase subunit A"
MTTSVIDIKKELTLLEETGAIPRSDLPENLIELLHREIEKITTTKSQWKEIVKETALAYNQALVEPGEGVGTVAAQSIGEPGTQMSIPPDEKVIIKCDKTSDLVSIGEFVDDLIEEIIPIEKRENPLQSIVCDIPDSFEIYVPGLCQNETVRWQRLLQVSRHPVNGELLKISTRSGREITATFAHSFVVRRNNEITPIESKNLRIGDRIPCVSNLIAETPLEQIPLDIYLSKSEVWYASELAKAIALGGKWRDEFGLGYTVPVKKEALWRTMKKEKDRDLISGFVYPKAHHSDHTRIPEVIDLTPLMGWFIGAYLAEGSATSHFLSIANNNRIYQNQVIDFANSLGLNSHIKEGIGEFGPSSSVIISSSVLTKWFKKMCGTSANNKRVPEWALNTTNDFIRGLLRGYFDGDGNISVNRNMIRASSNSKELRDGICLLLSRIGIFTSKGKSKQYTLTIPGRYASKYREMIGFDIPHKKTALDQLVDVEEGKVQNKEKTYDILDMIPGFGSIFDDLQKKLKLPARLVTKLTRKQKVGRRTLKKYIDDFKTKALELKVDIEKEISILSRAVNSDVIWDEIVKLESVRPSHPLVYDFSVSELETFITVEGLVTHNTLRTFHFAGVAEFDVTLGLPRLIEIVDARKNPSTPTMKIFLEKGYRTKEDSVRKVIQRILMTKVEKVANEVLLDLIDKEVEILLDAELMEDKGVTIEEVNETLKNSRTTKAAQEITADEDTIYLRFKEDTETEKLQSLREKIKGVLIKGVRGIHRAIMRRDRLTEEWVIHTQGSNLIEVLKIEGVDKTRTVTNSIQEIYEVLGVEAARFAIIDEARSVLEEQGLDVDIRHLMLVSDIMTSDGYLQQIGRHGISGGKSSVLARASFEVTVRHLLGAAILGEEDNLKGIAENVIVGQMIPLGTGVPTLLRTPKPKGGKKK